VRRATAAAALCAAALAGCGGPAGDLFEVERTGSIPGARVRLVVSDDGTARCNGSSPRAIGDPRLLTARELARGLDDAAVRGKHLSPAPGSILSYRVRTPGGIVTYSDSSRGQTKAMLQLQGFVRDVARNVCGLPR
jgi:hypothetical protein